MGAVWDILILFLNQIYAIKRHANRRCNLYRNVLGQGSQTHSDTAMHGICQHAAMRAQTQILTVQTATKRSVMYMLTTLCTQHSAGCMWCTRVYKLISWLFPMHCFDSVFFTFHNVDVCGMIQTDLDHETQTIFATFRFVYYFKVSAICSKICDFYVVLSLHINNRQGPLQ